MNWNELSKEIYSNNRKWWYDSDGNKLDRDPRELILLCISEVSEATEGLRRGLQDDHLPAYPMVTVELADTLIRLLDLAGGFNIEIWQHDNHSTTYDKESSNLLSIIEDLVFCAYAFDNEPREDLGDCVRYGINAILKHAEIFNRDVIPALHDKINYNKTRKDHTHEERAKEGGKRF